jgi:hypothetical protein
VKERPILFSAPMVRAILAGTKTQTRRLVDLSELKRATTPGYDWTWRGQAPIRSIAQQRRYPRGCWQDVRNDALIKLSPYGGAGDRLWVRETWSTAIGATKHTPSEAVSSRWPIWYRADDTRRFLAATDGGPAFMTREGRWRPAIHMPREASRVSLLVESVRVEQLNAISPLDAIAEGVFGDGRYRTEAPLPYPVVTFKELWESINGERAPWTSNPWVWVVTFSREGATT